MRFFKSGVDIGIGQKRITRRFLWLPCLLYELKYMDNGEIYFDRDFRWLETVTMEEKRICGGWEVVRFIDKKEKLEQL